MVRLSIATLGVAAFAMAASPAAALELAAVGTAPAKVQTGEADKAYGWRHHRRRHHGIDAGDVIAGVLVLGSIAAIASAASSNRNRQRVETRYPRRDDAGYDMRGDARRSSGMNRAIDMCVDQVERGSEQVGSVDNASRTGDGWRVSGALDDGGGWNCWIDNDGRIRQVDLGEWFSYSGPEPRLGPTMAAGPQLSDADYARARAAVDQQGSEQFDDGDLQDVPQPAYPGGPLPGEEGYEEALTG